MLVRRNEVQDCERQVFSFREPWLFLYDLEICLNCILWFMVACISSHKFMEWQERPMEWL
ncbi:unnamed protein product [Arabidopsis halleri]